MSEMKYCVKTNKKHVDAKGGDMLLIVGVFNTHDSAAKWIQAVCYDKNNKQVNDPRDYAIFAFYTLKHNGEAT